MFSSSSFRAFLVIFTLFAWIVAAAPVITEAESGALVLDGETGARQVPVVLLADIESSIVGETLAEAPPPAWAWKAG